MTSVAFDSYISCFHKTLGLFANSLNAQHLLYCQVKFVQTPDTCALGITNVVTLHVRVVVTILTTTYTYTSFARLKSDVALAF